MSGYESEQRPPESALGQTRELEPGFRLETDLIFLRHGVAEKLPGADQRSEIDSRRKHTEEGTQQVYEGGKKAALDLNLSPDVQVVIVSRSSPRERAKQTVADGLRGFTEQLQAQGLHDQSIDRQTSIKPARKAFDYGNHTAIYGAGGTRRGNTKGLSEEWTRNPELLQKDTDTAMETALTDDPNTKLDANNVLADMTSGYQNTVVVADRATTLLSENWHARNQDNPSAKPPRLVIFEGAHGFVSEPWLKEVVTDFEQTSGEPVKLELGYGEYWRLHWPASPSESPTLHIDGKIIPVSEKYLKKINAKSPTKKE